MMESPPLPVENQPDMGDKGPGALSIPDLEASMGTITEVTPANGKQTKTELTSKDLTQAEFIRLLPPNLSVEEVIEKGKERGFEISRDRVNYVRRTMKRAKRGKLSATALKARQKAAGQKAAATKAARKQGKSEPKAKRLPKTTDSKSEAQFKALVVELGFNRSEELLDEVRELALRSV